MVAMIATERRLRMRMPGRELGAWIITDLNRDPASPELNVVAEPVAPTA